jgi:hypothetical protein
MSISGSSNSISPWTSCTTTTAPAPTLFMELIDCDEALLNVSKVDLESIRYLFVRFSICQFCISRSAIRFYDWYKDWVEEEAFTNVREVSINVNWSWGWGQLADVFQIFHSKMKCLWSRNERSGAVRFYVQGQGHFCMPPAAGCR